MSCLTFRYQIQFTCNWKMNKGLRRIITVLGRTSFKMKIFHSMPMQHPLLTRRSRVIYHVKRFSADCPSFGPTCPGIFLIDIKYSKMMRICKIKMKMSNNHRIKNNQPSILSFNRSLHGLIRMQPRSPSRS